MKPFDALFIKGIMALSLVGFVYILSQSIAVSNKRQIGTQEGIYANKVSTKSKVLQRLTHTLTAHCTHKVCKVQALLDYVSNIPYKINTFHTNFPQDTLALGYGDCDDKSNLLISMLHILGIEAYFVLVPKHIFVIVPLERVEGKVALYIDGRAYYILETTAKGSSIGYPLRYRVDQIHAVIDPFSNQKIPFERLEYR